MSKTHVYVVTYQRGFFHNVYSNIVDADKAAHALKIKLGMGGSIDDRVDIKKIKL